MRVLMLGWEYPPFISGGLGTACHGLTRAMARLGTQVLFVLPSAVEAGGSDWTDPGDVPVRSAAALGQEQGVPAITFRPVPSQLPNPYQVPASTEGQRAGASGTGTKASRFSSECLCVIGSGAPGGYEGDLIHKIRVYADRCIELTRGESYDVIHAHDWVTFPAGRALAAMSGKPLVVHVHSTEFDRSGEHIHQPVYDIEREGAHAATTVIAVSHLTKRILVERYGVPPEKIRVVHNGIEPNPSAAGPSPRAPGQKVVLFLGRITMQKGPEFFVRAARRVMEKIDDVRFVVAGWGDLAPPLIEHVAATGMGQRVVFTGFLRGREVEQAFRLADVYVMPSVSEPFGLTALEAIRCGTPVILSRNSGVAEVLRGGAMKVDFWDVDEMANKIVAVLRHPEVAEMLRRNGQEEIRRLNWDEAARKCMGVYREGVAGGVC